MDLAIALRQRVTWTQRWLKGVDQKYNEAITEDVDFELIQKDDNEPHHDIISLSSQDPATSCADEEDETHSETFSWPSHCPSCGWPFDFCDLCETTHANWQTHDPWYWEDPYDPDSKPNTTHIAYEFAGRDITHTFRDFRSPAKARRCRSAHEQKYYNHRFIKPGQLNAAHLKISNYYDIRPVLPENAEIVVMNKRMLYHEAQMYPRPPRSHRRRREKDSWPCPRVVQRRKEKKKAHFQADRNFIDARGLYVYLSELPYDYDWSVENEALSRIHTSEEFEVEAAEVK